MDKTIEKQQGVFITYKKNSKLLTLLNFKLCECMAEKGKAFTDRKFIKQCLWNKLGFLALLFYAG